MAARSPPAVRRLTPVSTPPPGSTGRRRRSQRLCSHGTCQPRDVLLAPLGGTKTRLCVPSRQTRYFRKGGMPPLRRPEHVTAERLAGRRAPAHHSRRRLAWCKRLLPTPANPAQRDFLFPSSRAAPTLSRGGGSRSAWPNASFVSIFPLSSGGRYSQNSGMLSESRSPRSPPSR